MGRHRVPRTVPQPRPRGARFLTHQGHHPTVGTVRGQGFSREHHDHRPGSQRPRAIGRPGSVVVTRLLDREEHPGLAHLVSTVRARLADGVGWADILAATFPPGSVTGAPKIRAQQVISELEPVPRGPYCGAIGFVDADAGTARLAVGIRTFFTSRGPAGRTLNFGTGAGITYSSDPEAEWVETELKAARLI